MIPADDITMIVKDVHTITGRGTVLTGNPTGEFMAGDYIVCVRDDQITRVTGVESFGKWRPSTPVGLLIRLPFEKAAPGQMWRLVHRDDSLHANLLGLYAGSSQ